MGLHYALKRVLVAVEFASIPWFLYELYTLTREAFPFSRRNTLLIYPKHV